MVNSAPIANVDFYEVHGFMPWGLYNVLTNDSDPDGDTLSITGWSFGGLAGVVDLSFTGDITFTPDYGFTGLTSFQYGVNDGTDGVSGTVYFNVVNERPVARADHFVTHETVSGNVLDNDSDADDDTFSVSSFSLEGLQGTLTLLADGNFTFTAAEGFSGATSFTYELTDQYGAASTGIAVIEVRNEKPVARGDTVNAAGGQVTGTFSVFANDSDADSDTLSITSITLPQNGGLVLLENGTFNYKANSGFNGTDYFTYVMTDGHGGISSATVALAVGNVFTGNGAANTITGSTEADYMQGRVGNDAYTVDHVLDFTREALNSGTDRVLAKVSYELSAGQHIEVLRAFDLAEVSGLRLTGNGLAQTVIGNSGGNRLDGKGGADTLTGRAGVDSFVFSSALAGGNADTITDFMSGTDLILLDDAIFAGIGEAGSLSADVFASGPAGADGRILYNASTGRIFYDADGSGAGARVLFAQVTAGLALSASDFVVI